MKRTVIFTALAATLLASCGNKETEVQEKAGMSPSEGVWYIPGDEDYSYFSVSDSVVSYAESGMDGMEFQGILNKDGDNGVISFEGSDIKGRFVFNPADSTVTVVIPGINEDGSDFTVKASNKDKARLVYSWAMDGAATYADSSLAVPADSVAFGEIFEMEGFGGGWYEVSGKDGNKVYLKTTEFEPTFDFIPEKWLGETYQRGDDVMTECVELTRKGDVFGVMVTRMFTDGRAAQTIYYSGKADGNRINVDAFTIDSDVFESLDAAGFEKLELPFTVMLVYNNGGPMLLNGGEGYYPASF